MALSRSVIGGYLAPIRKRIARILSNTRAMTCVQSRFPIKVLGGASTVAPSLPRGLMRAIYAGKTSHQGKADRQRKGFFCHDSTDHRNAETLSSGLILPITRACARTGAKIRGNSLSTPFPTPCFSRDLSIDRTAASDTRRRTRPSELSPSLPPACARNEHEIQALAHVRAQAREEHARFAESNNRRENRRSLSHRSDWSRVFSWQRLAAETLAMCTRKNLAGTRGHEKT